MSKKAPMKATAKKAAKVTSNKSSKKLEGKSAPEMAAGLKPANSLAALAKRRKV